MIERTKNLSEEQKKLFLEAFTNCSKDISEFKVGIEKLISIYSHSNALQSSVFIESHIQVYLYIYIFRESILIRQWIYGNFLMKCFMILLTMAIISVIKIKIKSYKSVYIYIYSFICIEDTNYRSATKSSLIDKLYEINNSYDKINLQKLKRWQLKDMIKYF